MGEDGGKRKSVNMTLERYSLNPRDGKKRGRKRVRFCETEDESEGTHYWTYTYSSAVLKKNERDFTKCPEMRSVIS